MGDAVASQIPHVKQPECPTTYRWMIKYEQYKTSVHTRPLGDGQRKCQLQHGGESDHVLRMGGETLMCKSLSVLVYQYGHFPNSIFARVGEFEKRSKVTLR